MKTAHIFYTAGRYIRGKEEDFLSNGIVYGITMFQGYSKYNKPKSNKENVIKEIKNTIDENGKQKYNSIQFYTDKKISDGQYQYIKKELIQL